MITTLSRDALTIVGLVIVMVSQDPMLTVLALMLVPVAALGVRQIGQRVRRIMSMEFAGMMQIMESLQETAQGLRIVKAFTLEDFMRKRQGAAIRGFQTAANKLASVSSRTSPIMRARVASPSPPSCSIAATPSSFAAISPEACSRSSPR